MLVLYGIGLGFLGFLLALTDGSRFLPRRWRWETRRLGLNLIVVGFGLAGVLLILTQPWVSGLTPFPAENITALHGRQAAGGAFLNTLFYVGPTGAGLLLIAAAWASYRATRT